MPLNTANLENVMQSIEHALQTQIICTRKCYMCYMQAFEMSYDPQDSNMFKSCLS